MTCRRRVRVIATIAPSDGPEPASGRLVAGGLGQRRLRVDLKTGVVVDDLFYQ
jgi:hypothetical protein